MPPLDLALQDPLREVFDRLLADARATARPRKTGPSEVDFIENFHALVAANLEDAVARRIANSGLTLSVKVETALVHGAPFQARPRWPYGSAPTIEIGDLMLVGERYERESGGGPDERQALLLQMKVGKPKLRARPDGGPTRQAALYARWPPIDWVSSAMAKLPGSFPRKPAPGPCDAAQFGIVPPASTSFEALPLEASGRRFWFGEARSLADELARTVRLDLGVDATPDGGDGWPRIVEDMLQVAPLKTFRASSSSKAPNAITRDHRDFGASRGRFVILRVGIAPPGVFD
jgi:hypothetical protein